MFVWAIFIQLWSMVVNLLLSFFLTCWSYTKYIAIAFLNRYGVWLFAFLSFYNLLELLPLQRFVSYILRVCYFYSCPWISTSTNFYFFVSSMTDILADILIGLIQTWYSWIILKSCTVPTELTTCIQYDCLNCFILTNLFFLSFSVIDEWLCSTQPTESYTSTV